MLIFTISACTFLLLIFSLRLLFTKTENSAINKLLGIVLLTRSGMNILFLMIVTGYIVQYPLVLKSLAPFYYVIPAMIFLYIKGHLIKDSKFKKQDVLHFLPFVFGIVDVLPFYLNIDNNVSKSLFAVENEHVFLFQSVSGVLSQKLGFLLHPIIYWTYIVLIFRILKKQKFFSNLKENVCNNGWIISLFGFIVVTQLFGLVQLYKFHFSGYNHLLSMNSGNYLRIIPVAILVIFILSIIQRPHVFYGYLFVFKNFQFNFKQTPIVIAGMAMDEVEQEETLNLKNKALLSEELSVKYGENIVQLLNEKKLYLSPDLQISDISREIGIPNHQCSYVLKSFFKKNFRDWINEYRVLFFIEEFKINKGRLTIEGLAQESGFRNLTTFYNAFKKVTNQSPSEYFTSEV